MRGRDLWMPLIVSIAVIGFVGYMWFQGRSHIVEYAVTSSSIRFAHHDARAMPETLRRDAPRGRVLLVKVRWEAAETIDGGNYYVLVTAPPGWTSYACEPECDWTTTEDLTRWAQALPRRTFPDGAKFPADETGSVAVALVAPRDDATDQPDFEPAAWLVQTDGDNVLGAKRIPVAGG